jgi:hypothetical protein
VVASAAEVASAAQDLGIKLEEGDEERIVMIQSLVRGKRDRQRVGVYLVGVYLVDVPWVKEVVEEPILGPRSTLGQNGQRQIFWLTKGPM